MGAVVVGVLNSIRAMSAKRKVCRWPSLKMITTERSSSPEAALGNGEAMDTITGRTPITHNSLNKVRIISSSAA